VKNLALALVKFHPVGDASSPVYPGLSVRPLLSFLITSPNSQNSQIKESFSPKKEGIFLIQRLVTLLSAF